MKKNILFFLFLIASYSVFSQTLSLVNTNHMATINYGDTIFVEDSANVSEMVVSIHVTNTDSILHKIYCRKQIIDTVANTTNTFCWAGTCYPPAVLISNGQDIGAGETNTEFSAHYEPWGFGGTTILKYTFTIFHNTTDSAWFYVKFYGTTGINDNYLLYSISTPYPNPANNLAYVNYSIPVGSKAILQVMNICGKIEKQYSLNESNGALKMNVSDLSSGIYFCSLTIDNKVIKTSKLIISH